MNELFKISDYFDMLVNEIDLKSERLLNLIDTESYNFKEKWKMLINERRICFINEIEAVQRFSSSRVGSLLPYCFILDKTNMNLCNYLQYSDSDAELRLLIDETLGFLILLSDGCLDEQEMILFKHLLRSGPTSRLFDPNDSIDQRLKCNQITTLNSASFNIFKQNASNFVIKTTKRELLTVDSLTIVDINGLDDRIFHLFLKYERPLRVEIHQAVDTNVKFDQLCDLCSRLRSQFANIQSISLRVNSLTVPDLSRLVDSDLIRINVAKGNTMCDLQLSNLINVKLLDLSGTRITYVNSSTFGSLNYLTELSLIGNQIERIESFSFGLLVSLQSLNLANNRLESIEQFTFGNLHQLLRLDVSSNLISYIHSQAFSTLHRLERLYLENNRLESLHDQLVFENMTNLRELNLSSNKLNFIDPKVLSKLAKLEILSLNFNPFNSILAQTFAGLDNLAELNMQNTGVHQLIVHNGLNILNLSKNRIECLNIDPLCGYFDRLTYLDLDGNQIYQFRVDKFIKLKVLTLRGNLLDGSIGFGESNNLERLVLTGNLIEKLDRSLFNGLSNLNELYLDGNGLNSLGEQSFDCLPQLRHLNLANNKLIDIHPDTFSGMFSLRTLDLSCNQIECLKFMHSAVNLETVNLKSNKICVVQSGAFSGSINLTSLNLSDNRIVALEARSFDGLELTLTHVDLRFNLIESFDFTVLAKLARLRTLCVDESSTWKRHLNSEILHKFKKLRIYHSFCVDF